MKMNNLCALLALAMGDCEIAQTAQSLLLIKYKIKITKNDPPTKTGAIQRLLH